MEFSFVIALAFLYLYAAKIDRMLKIYYLKMSDYEEVPDEELAGRVCEETRRHTAGFRSGQMRRQKWLGEGMVRSLLESEWQIRPEDYLLRKAEHGKPYVYGLSFPVFYNLSHSGDYLVCGLSEREVGVDIQRVGHYRPEIIRRFFHPHEVLRLEQCESEARRRLFFKYWSAKESFLKYTGTGLSASLSGFEVSFEEQDPRVLKPEGLPQVYMKECRIDADYVCFVCSESPEIPEIIPFVFPKPLSGV